jgi:hypothetical protein
LSTPPVPAYIFLAATLILALCLAYGSSHQHDPRSCKNCGWVICYSCCLVRDGAWLCHSCGETADRAKSKMVLATLLKNRSRAQGLKNAQRLSRLGRLLPGAGHLAAGQLGKGLVRLILLTTSLFLLLCGWAFDPSALFTNPGLLLPEETIHPVWFPLPAAAWPGPLSITVVLGGLLFLALYLLAQLDAVGLRHRLPDRLLMTPFEPENSGIQTQPPTA